MTVGGLWSRSRRRPAHGRRPCRRPCRRRVGWLRPAIAFVLVAALLAAPAMSDADGWRRSTTAAAPPGGDGPPDAGAMSAHASEMNARQNANLGDLDAAYRSALGGRIQAVLDAQSAALLAGDEPGFLASTEPAVRPELQRRFGLLRAMKVAGWAQQLTGDPEVVPGSPQRWRSGVQLRYCFAVPGCPLVGVTVQTEWTEVGGAPRLLALAPSPAAELGPRPWEVTDLRVAVGSRVIVAATARYVHLLAGTLAAAERAAAVTDRYARWRPAPSRYLVYLAGPDEWGRWYGVHQAPWVAGYAMPVGTESTEVILNAQRIGNRSLADTLRHEFTHAVTLTGVRRDLTSQWWLVEGIAEYVRMLGRGIDDYPGLYATKKYARSGRWPGEVALTAPPDSASSDDASGRYGVAFLALRRIAERYGENRLLDFFNAVARQGNAPSAAARTTLGASWEDVRADCVRYIRKVAGDDDDREGRRSGDRD